MNCHVDSRNLSDDDSEAVSAHGDGGTPECTVQQLISNWKDM